MNANPTARHLSGFERRVLLGLIGAHPTESCPAIARRFEARTGRPLSKVAVRRAWVIGYRTSRPPGKGVTA